MLVISGLDVLELGTATDHRQNIGLRHPRFHKAVVRIDTVVGYIVVGGDAAKVLGGQVAGVLIVNDHLSLVQVPGCSDNDIAPLLAKKWILRRLGMVHSVDERVLAHAHVQISVTEPRNGLVDVGNSPQGKFGVQVVHHLLNEPTDSSRNDVVSVSSNTSSRAQPAAIAKTFL